MGLCNYFLLLILLCYTCVKAKKVQEYTFFEETGQDAYIGNIPQDLKLRPLSSSEIPREYTIINGGDKVRIDSQTGDLRTAVNLDRETLCLGISKCVVNADVFILPEVHSDEIIQVQLNLEDINDNIPFFPIEIIQRQISESAVTGTIIRLDSAVDPDIGSNAIQRYKIASSPSSRYDKNGNSVPFFSLETIENPDDTKIPQIRLSKALDYEKIDSYELILSAVDGGTPRLTGTATVLISVSDANDNQPSFDKSSYVVNVSEDAAPDYEIIQLEATDLDSGSNAKILYRFSSIVNEQDRAKFNLDKDTGVLTVSELGLDYESKKIHHLTIEASDRGPNPSSAYTTVTVEVKNVNDEAPHIDVNFMGLVTRKSGSTSLDTNSQSVFIKENTRIGSNIAFVTVADPDTILNGNANCRLQENLKFEMINIDQEEARYLLKTKGELDREVKRFHNIEIKAWDFGQPPLNSSMTIVVELLDENDNDPSFGKDSYELSVGENVQPGAVIATLKAEDIDFGVNAEISYRAEPYTNNSYVPFAMNSVTGSVYFKKDAAPLDAENRTDPFVLIVTATDNGKPQRSTNTTLEIKVADENDNPPEFKKGTYSFRVREDEKLGKYIGSVEAYDKDIEKKTNGKVTYSFLNDQTTFSIKAETGEIHFNGEPEDLDRETRQPYELTVVAADHGSRSLTASVKVYIELIDINDNPPKVKSPNVTQDFSILYIRPPAPKPELIMPIKPKFFYEEKELEGFEEISNSTANPFPKISIKKVKKSTLKDILLIGSSASRKLYTPTNHPILITNIDVKDPDDGENGRVRFAMAEGNIYNYFSVDMDSGSVRLQIKDEKELRQMRQGCHVIKVNVNDLGKPTRHTATWVNIYVTEANPGSINTTEALRACMDNPFFPAIFLPSSGLATAGLSLMMIIVIGSCSFIFVLILIIVLICAIRYKGRCCDKRSRTYNCKNSADTYNDVAYPHGSIDGRRKHISGPIHHFGTVDSRSSFYSEWTASQMHMAQQEKSGMRVQGDEDDSIRSHNSARDSGTGDSVPNDAFHTTVIGPGIYRQPYQNNLYQRQPHSYGHPQIQPNRTYLPPQDDLMATDDESRCSNRHYPANPRMMFTSKCTNECRLYGHGDNCWMPDSLQRPSSRMGLFKGVDEFDGDSLKYQKRAVTPNSYKRYQEQIRYANVPSSSSYFYETGSNFNHHQQRGNFSSFRDDNMVGSDGGSPAHSQIAASNVSRQQSTNSGYHHSDYPHYGQTSPSHSNPMSFAFSAASPAPYDGQTREKAYVNLQGVSFDRTGGMHEEVHSSLSSASSGNQHPRYQNPRGYPQEQSYHASRSPEYHSYGNQANYDGQSQGYSGNLPYEDTFAATNLILSPKASEPTDYKQRLEEQVPHQQTQMQKPVHIYGNTSEIESHPLLNNNSSSQDEEEQSPSIEKLSTIREELDADEVVAGIDGLLL